MPKNGSGGAALSPGINVWNPWYHFAPFLGPGCLQTGWVSSDPGQAERWLVGPSLGGGGNNCSSEAGTADRADPSQLY